ncbi:MAG: efflux RND transporter periplasmic adaptor subunit [Bacillaceae bacterium]|nr:efflux RND transporter periplasmic adaptor subunit [Bacillaceae bacterium]
MKRNIKSLSLIGIISILLFTACSQSQETGATPEEEKYVPVTTAEVQKGSIVETTRLSAKLEPVEQASLAPMVSGKVEDIFVEIGDKVEKGQKLVALDKDNIQNQVNNARASLQVAQAGYQQSLESAKQRVIQAQTNYATAKQAYEDAKRNAERMQQLYEAEAISRQQWEQAQTQLTQAESRYLQAKQEYEHVFGTQPTPDTGNSNINPAELAPTLESVRMSAAQVEQARAQLQSAMNQLEQTVLTSPITGEVANVDVHAGEIASPQMPIMYVVNLDQMIIRLNVPESLIGNIRQGQEIDVDIPTLNQTVKGKVTAVSAAADPNTLTFPVKIQIDNPDHTLKGGMIARVSLKQKSSENTLTIPTSALLENNGLYRVFVVTDKDGKKVAEERIVQRGILTSDKVEITDGLEEGEQVVVKGKNLLSDGATVKIVTDQPTQDGDSQ